VVIANGSLMMSSAILLEAGLAFFGLSDASTVSWGSMLSNAQQFLLVSFWLPFFPGLAISLTGLSLNLLGDGLTKALSPKLRRSAPAPRAAKKKAAAA
jgi:peptide/nickel transport system permease protein